MNAPVATAKQRARNLTFVELSADDNPNVTTLNVGDLIDHWEKLPFMLQFALDLRLLSHDCPSTVTVDASSYSSIASFARALNVYNGRQTAFGGEFGEPVNQASPQPRYPASLKLSVVVNRDTVALVAYPDARDLKPGDLLGWMTETEPQVIYDPDPNHVNDDGSPVPLGSIDPIRETFFVERVTGRVVIAKWISKPGFLGLLGAMPKPEFGARFHVVTEDDAARGHIAS